MTQKRRTTSRWASLLADRLRTSRRDESQAELSARSKVSDRTISSIEGATLAKPPRVSTLIRLALATGVDPDDWLKLVGLQAEPAQIERERNLVRARAAWGDLEPAQQIKQEAAQQAERFVQRYVDERLAAMVPAEQLKAELNAIVNSAITRASIEPASDIKAQLIKYFNIRLEAYERMLGDVKLRVDHLASSFEHRLRLLEEAQQELAQARSQTTRNRQTRSSRQKGEFT